MNMAGSSARIVIANWFTKIIRNQPKFGVIQFGLSYFQPIRREPGGSDILFPIFALTSNVLCLRLRITERANVTVCEKIVFNEVGVVTIALVVLTAGVFAIGIAAYGAFEIDNENTTAILLVNQDGSKPIVIGDNAIARLIARTKLQTMIFVSCIFKTSALQDAAVGKKFGVCS